MPDHGILKTEDYEKDTTTLFSHWDFVFRGYCTATFSTHLSPAASMINR